MYSSVQPRLAARKSRLQLAEMEEEERRHKQKREEDRRKSLDVAVKKLAEYDVKNPTVPSHAPDKRKGLVRLDWPKSKTIEDFALGFASSLTSDDMTYVNEKYPIYFEEATREYLEHMRAEAEKESFNELREKHKKVVRRVQEAHEESLISAREDPYTKKFEMLTESEEKESVTQK